MLKHFSAGDKIIFAVEDRSVGIKERIIQLYAMPRVFKHRRKRRAGAAAVIKAFLRITKPLYQRGRKFAKESPVAFIKRVVPVPRVAFFFRFRSEELCRIDECRLAGGASPIVRTAGGYERNCPSGFTYRAFRFVFG